ncbi:MAG: hypothetical protein M3235_18035, partial [Actinomycetota bacterium]|nr:hypothetical protein [Actinomycetota bacterium]
MGEQHRDAVVEDELDPHLGLGGVHGPPPLAHWPGSRPPPDLAGGLVRTGESGRDAVQQVGGARAHLPPVRGHQVRRERVRGHCLGLVLFNHLRPV